MSSVIIDKQKQLDEFKATSKRNAKERVQKFNQETNSTPVQRLRRAVKNHSNKE